MRVIIIGNGDSIWTKNYIKNVLLPQSINTTLLTNRTIKGEFFDFYIANSVRILYNSIDNRAIQSIPKLRVLFNWLYSLFLVLKNGSFDTIHIHYVTKWSCNLAYVVRKKAKNIICSFWGSDLLQIADRDIKSIEKCLKQCKYITLATNEMKGKFNLIFGYDYEKRIKILVFGIDLYSLIDKISKKESISYMKSVLGLPQDKTIISIGYNQSEMQQHLKVIGGIKNLLYEEKEKIFLVFPMTYKSLNREYKNRVILDLNQEKFHYKIFEEYMANEDVARLRLVTDIFIHAQTTDAFSATMQEYLYGGASVINGSWLSYKEIENIGIKCFKFSEFEELRDIISFISQNGKTLEMQKQQNKKLLYNLCSSDIVSREWNKLYIN